jgi:hypothetical protein
MPIADDNRQARQLSERHSVRSRQGSCAKGASNAGSTGMADGTRGRVLDLNRHQPSVVNPKSRRQSAANNER